jgi:DNA-binding IclR family transcriptional regulator
MDSAAGKTAVKRAATASAAGAAGAAATKAADGGVRALTRGLDILAAFRPGDGGLTVAELQKRVGLSRPTLYRLLATLEASRFLVSSGEPQRFSYGSAVAHMAHLWTASFDIQETARPMMQRLWSQTQETVALFVPDGMQRRCVAELASPQPLSFKRGVGYSERLVLGASGRSILAHMSLSAMELKAYANGLERVELAQYPKEFARIRSRGFATAKNELIAGAVAIAAPFFDGADRVAGSICIFGPAVRQSPAQTEAFGQLLVAESAALSRALGQVRPAGQANAN